MSIVAGQTGEHLALRELMIAREDNPASIQAAPPKGRVLAVAYRFPPMASSASIRNLKILRHMPATGWELDLLTVRTDATFPGEGQDESLCSKLPKDVGIVRTRCLYVEEQLARLKARLGGVFRRTETTPPAGSGAGQPAAQPDNSATQRKPSIWQRLKQFVSHLVSTPDRYAGWFPFAV